MDNATVNLVMPAEADISTVKKEFHQTADKILSRFTYSCGLVIETEQTAESVDFRTNWKIVQLPDGRYAIQRP